MFNINEDSGEIYLTRGDSARFNLIPNLVYSTTDEPEEYEMGADDIIRFTVRKRVNTPILLQKEVRGSTLIHLKPEDTSGLQMGKQYVYDAELTTSEGDVYTFIETADFVLGNEVTYDG